MRLDKYSNPIFTEHELFEILYQGTHFSAQDAILVNERTSEVKQLEEQLGFKLLEPYETHFELSDYDSACQSNWFMPDNYKTLDIEEWILTQALDLHHTRVKEELEAYKARNMLDLLRWLKYFVDTCSKENVVWGVGRGSSVASYVLYLIGVHSVDSIKYNLDWKEFLR
jgi:DNA polymerase-3 subunit alpha